MFCQSCWSYISIVVLLELLHIATTRESNHMTLENMLRDMSKKKKTYEYQINSIFSSPTNVSNIFPTRTLWDLVFRHDRRDTEETVWKQNKTCEFPTICSFASVYTFFLWHFSVNECQSCLSDMRVWTQKTATNAHILQGDPDIFRR